MTPNPEPRSLYDNEHVSAVLRKIRILAVATTYDGIWWPVYGSDGLYVRTRTLAGGRREVMLVHQAAAWQPGMEPWDKALVLSAEMWARVCALGQHVNVWDAAIAMLDLVAHERRTPSNTDPAQRR